MSGKPARSSTPQVDPISRSCNRRCVYPPSPPPTPFQRKEAMMRLKLFLSGLESQATHPSMPYANLGYLDSRFRLQAIGRTATRPSDLVCSSRRRLACILNPMASSACFSSSGKRGEHFSHSSAGRVIAYPYSPFDRSSSFLLVLTGPCLRDLCRGRPVGQA